LAKKIKSIWRWIFTPAKDVKMDEQERDFFQGW